MFLLLGSILKILWLNLSQIVDTNLDSEKVTFRSGKFPLKISSAVVTLIVVRVARYERGLVTEKYRSMEITMRFHTEALLAR